MEIQTKKQSDLEKRLRLLHQQVYGKEKLDVRSERLDNQTYILQSQNPSSSIHHPSSDVTYLHQDLLKICILAGSTLGLEIILFILSKNHILNFNFF